ncbi:MAG: type VI secretion system baseplate subunit TssG [Alphaproteobacteria bacterium]
MASTNGRPSPSLKKSLKDALSQEAEQFEFHALVKVLERLNPKATPLGEGPIPDAEALRIKTHIGFEFPSTDIVSLQQQEDSPLEVTTNFFNVAGIQGPLPPPYIQMVIERDRQKDTAFHSFLDIFNHRLTSILHRIRKKYWVGVSASPPENTFMGRILKSFLGLSNITQGDKRLKTLDRSLLFYAGLIWQHPRSLIALEKLLTHYFNVPFKIEPFHGGWISIPTNQQTVIGAQGRFQTLGKTAVLGDRFWEQQAYIRIHVGPMGIKDYINFLKPGKAYQSLKILVAYFCGEDQDFRLNLILKKEEVPSVRLGQGMALHWTSWVNRDNTDPQTDDAQNILNKKSFKIL